MPASPSHVITHECWRPPAPEETVHPLRTPLRRALALTGLTAVVVTSGSIAVAESTAVQDITDRALASAPEATDLSSDADDPTLRGLNAAQLDRMRAADEIAGEDPPLVIPRERSAPDRGDRTAAEPQPEPEPEPEPEPAAEAGYIGHASWYGPGFHGKKTASGEVYDQNAMTAAHKTLPFGTNLRVTNTANGRSVVVRVNDRGPFVAGRDLDLSRAAAQQLGFDGVATVRIEQL